MAGKAGGHGQLKGDEAMADNQVERGSMEPHVRTYDRVIGMFKWGGIAVFVIAVLVVLTIAR